MNHALRPLQPATKDGEYIHHTLQEWLNRLLKDVNRALALISSGGALRVPSMDTADRDALAAEAGDTIYNEDTGTLQAYLGGAWVNL